MDEPHAAAAALPRVILFDLDDTILDDTGGADESWRLVCVEAAAELPGIEVEKLVDVLLQTRIEYWSDPERNRLGRLGLRAAACDIVRLGLAQLAIEEPELADVMGNHYRDLRDAAVAVLPGAVETLVALQKRGVTMGLVTNGAAEPQRAKIDKFALAGYFGYIGIEGERGFGKPEPAAFETALAALRVEPAQAWMVGDNLEHDIRAAKALGLHGVWVDKLSRGSPGEGVAPDRVVRAIGELLD
jgi:putative hydrolase of the HAD superfamily